MGVVAMVLGSIPSPSWKSLSIGPLNLRAYGLMIALGVIAGVALLGRLFERERIGTRDTATSLATWGVAAGVLGARAYHVITDWSRFSDNLASIPKIWEGGLGIPGGLLAGILMAAWQARRRGIPIAMVMTCAAPAIPLAQSIGRWGNWFNQELYGKRTDLPWALEIDDRYLPPGDPSGTTYHPTFLYESLWNLALCVVLLWIHRRFRLAPGRLMAAYLVGYGVGRFWIEGLRIDLSHEVGGLRWNQWVALTAVAGGAVYLLITRGRKWPVGPFGEESSRAASDDDSNDDSNDDPNDAGSEPGDDMPHQVDDSSQTDDPSQIDSIQIDDPAPMPEASDGFVDDAHD